MKNQNKIDAKQEQLERLNKQLEENPWDNLEENISVDNIVSAKINSINEFK